MDEENQFNLELQYKLFLGRMGLKEDKMRLQQRIETKRTFFAAWGQLLMVLKDELPKLPEEAGIAALESMTNQVGAFYLKETNRQN